MFADPAAAGRRSAEVRGVIGNSKWGRSTRLAKGNKTRALKKLAAGPLCINCQQQLGDPAKQTNPIIQQRLANYAAKLQAEAEA